MNKIIITFLISIVIFLVGSTTNSMVNAEEDKVNYDSTYLNKMITDPKNSCMNVECVDQFPGQCNVRGGEIFFARNTAVGICCGKCFHHSELDPETLPPGFNNH